MNHRDPVTFGTTDASVSRAMWTRFEPIHAVSYFAPHTAASFARSGVTGFWRSYFAGRASPLGRAGAQLVHAVFHSFAFPMVERAVPSVWNLIEPTQAWDIRQTSAGTSIGDCLDELSADEVDWIADELSTVVERLDPAGRPLFAAHLATPSPSPTTAAAAIWRSCTLLREHRGDTYVAAATSAGWRPLDLLVFAECLGSVPAGHATTNRGWTDDERSASLHRLAERALVDRDGAVTIEGRHRHRTLEAATDDVTSATWTLMEPAALERLSAGLTHIAGQITRRGWVTYPNAIGVPPPPRR